MKLPQIKQIIDLMKHSELTEFTIEEEGLKLTLKRGGAAPAQPPIIIAGALPSTTPPGAHEDISEPPYYQHDHVPHLAPPAADPAAPANPGTTTIKSPMVGIFYRASSPESKPLVETGDEITETTAVCVIEAMKVMNEIPAEIKGVVLEILVQNGQPVEYGQPLFKIKQ